MLPQRECIAFHEAGHAVVCWWLGHRFEYVSIERRHMQPEELPPLRRNIDVVIMYTLAGPLAEQYFAGGGQLPAQSGGAAAYDAAQALCRARERHRFPIEIRETDPRCQLAAEELIETLRVRTGELLAHAALWPGVEAVAGELLKRDPLSYDEVSAILENKGLRRKEPRDLGAWFPRKERA